MAVTTGEGDFILRLAGAQLLNYIDVEGSRAPEAAGGEANGEVVSVVNPVSVNSTFYIKME